MVYSLLIRIVLDVSLHSVVGVPQDSDALLLFVSLGFKQIHLDVYSF